MTEIKKKNRSPQIITVLVLGFIVFLAWSAYQAGGLGSKVTDADYYSKGLKYNSTMVEKRAAEVLGWNLETELEGHTVKFHLVDQQGGNIDRAIGTLYLAIPGMDKNYHLPLQEVTSGYYQVTLDDSTKGAIQARLELERDGARLNRHLLLNL